MTILQGRDKADKEYHTALTVLVSSLIPHPSSLTPHPSPLYEFRANYGTPDVRS
jgi:hypothetical protein